MRWQPGQTPAASPGRKLPRALLQKRIEQHRAEAQAAAEAGDLPAQIEALGKQAEAHRDLEQWRRAIDVWTAQAALYGDSADAEERLRPHAYASDAARELEDWPTAVEHAVWIDAIAGAADSDELRQYATAAIVAARQGTGLKIFADHFAAALEKLPEPLREKVRAEEHLHPTVTRDETG